MTPVSKKVSWEIIKRSFLPVVAIGLFIGAYTFYKMYVFPNVSAELHADIRKYIGTLFVFCVTFLIHQIASAVIDWYRANIVIATTTTLDDDLLPIMRRSFKVIIWIIAFLVILPFYGVNINALIAALGVSSLAIALAAQDTIANIISGFLIMIDRPFRVGDKIKLPTGEIVEVLEIGVRRSKFLSEDKAIIIVPNVDLSKSKIINYTYGKERLK
ncbi:MAG: mechanosensitive ion channel [Candidatus Omnitrophota bacterium]|nr:MAG: mechanosensitive ion channel [Candidatus Omnitrophota bacterium]